MDDKIRVVAVCDNEPRIYLSLKPDRKRLYTHYPAQQRSA
jgi:hypothetical protein